MKYTGNYNLKKPEQDDFYNIEDLNDNVDIIDVELKRIEKKVDNREIPVTSVNQKTGDIVLSAVDVGAETPNGAQAKVDTLAGEGNTKTVKEVADEVTAITDAVSSVKYLPPITTYDNVISLPSNTTKGQVSVGIKGNTRRNEFNLSKDINIANQSTYIISNSTLNITSTGVTGFVRWIYKLKPNTTYTLSARSTRTGTTGGGMQINASNPDGSTGATLATATNTLNPTLTFPTTETGEVKIAFYANSLGSSGEQATFTEILLEEGSEKRSFISYGTKSTNSAMRLKSVGKNIFDEELEYGALVYSTGVEIERNDVIRSKNYIGVRPNTLYTIYSSRRDIRDVIYVFEYDSNKNFIGYVALNVSSFGMTTSPHTCYLRFRSQTNGTGGYVLPNIDDLKIIVSESNVVGYEPHTSNTQYLVVKDDTGKILELKSLPNGTKDEVRMTANGGYECVKRTGKVILDGSENWLYRNNNGDFSTASLIISETYSKKLGQINFSVYYEELKVLKGIGQVSDISSTYLNEEITTLLGNTSSSDMAIYITVPNNELNTLDSAGVKNYITNKFNIGNPLTLTYQLADPRILPVHSSGLQAYENGTLYVDYVIPEVGFYAAISGLRISDTYRPIKSIDLLYKVDKNTGLRTELDVSKCIISEDRLKFTHPDLRGNDLVDWDYVATTESTNAGKSVIVPTNLKASIDSLLTSSMSHEEKIMQMLRVVSYHGSEINDLDLNLQSVVDWLLNLTNADVGLDKVTNDKQMPIVGGVFEGVVKAQNNISYTTAQLRNVILSTADPSGGNNGDIWIKYK